MVSNGSIQGQTGLTYHFLFFDIHALWRSVVSTRVPECQRAKSGALDQYDTERLGRLIFATIRKSVGLKGLNNGEAPNSHQETQRTNSAHFPQIIEINGLQKC